MTIGATETSAPSASSTRKSTPDPIEASGKTARERQTSLSASPLGQIPVTSIDGKPAPRTRSESRIRAASSGLPRDSKRDLIFDSLSVWEKDTSSFCFSSKSFTDTGSVTNGHEMTQKRGSGAMMPTKSRKGISSDGSTFSPAATTERRAPLVLSVSTKA